MDSEVFNYVLCNLYLLTKCVFPYLPVTQCQHNLKSNIYYKLEKSSTEFILRMNWEYRMGFIWCFWQKYSIQLWNLSKLISLFCRSFEDTHTHTHLSKSDVNSNTRVDSVNDSKESVIEQSYRKIWSQQWCHGDLTFVILINNQIIKVVFTMLSKDSVYDHYYLLSHSNPNPKSYNHFHNNVKQ